MAVITISNQKGGTGKTSVTYNVGCVIAKEFNKRVLFIDADGQANLTTAFGLNPDKIKNNIARLLVEESYSTKDFIIDTVINNAKLIASNQSTFKAEKQLYDRTGREFVLNDAIEQIKRDFDYIFIDTPPHLGIITLNALIANDHIVLIHTASEFSLDGISQILNSVSEIQGKARLNINKIKIIGAIQNRYKSSTKVVNNKLNEIISNVSEIPKHFQTISDTTEMEKSQFEHKPIILFNSTHKLSEEFRIFAKELIECLD